MGNDPILESTLPICRKYCLSDLSHHSFWAVDWRGRAEPPDRPWVCPAPLCLILGYCTTTEKYPVLSVPITIDLDATLLTGLAARMWPVADISIRGQEQWYGNLQFPRWGEWGVCRRYDRRSFGTDQSASMLHLQQWILNSLYPRISMWNAPIDWWEWKKRV